MTKTFVLVLQLLLQDGSEHRVALESGLTAAECAAQLTNAGLFVIENLQLLKPRAAIIACEPEAEA